MATAPVTHICALRALAAGRRIRALVQGMPLAERAGRVDAVLKPGAALTLQVDRAAEEIGLVCFEQLAAEIGYRIHLIADAVKGEVIELGSARQREIVFAHLDAVD